MDKTQQMAKTNEIYIIESSDEEITNQENTDFTVEKINDIIFGLNQVSKTKKVADESSTPSKQIKESDEFVYVSDDSDYYEEQKETTNFNFHYDKLTIMYNDKLKNAFSGTINLNPEISLSRIDSKNKNMVNGPFSLKVHKNIDELERNDIDRHNNTCSIESTSNNVSRNTYKYSNSKSTPAKNTLTLKSEADSSSTIEHTKTLSSKFGKDKTLKKKEEFADGLSAQLHQFESFEQKLRNSFDISKDYKSNAMFVDLSEEQDITKSDCEESNKFLENKPKEPNFIQRSRSISSHKFYEPLSDDTEMVDFGKSDIQIRLNFQSTNNHITNNDGIQSLVESKTSNLTALTYEPEEKNDIFDYLKLDKRKPFELRQSLENEKKNKIRRSLRVERLKQIQENAKELLKLRKENEAYEAGGCPNDLVNESIISIKRNTCNDMPPVLEPISPTYKTNNTSRNCTSPNLNKKLNNINSITGIRKKLLPDGKYRSDKNTKKLQKNVVSIDDADINSDSSEDNFETKKCLSQEKNNCTPIKIQPYVRLKTLHTKNNTKKKLIRDKSKNTMDVSHIELNDENFRSSETFENFSNRVYCDILQQSPSSSNSDDLEENEDFSKTATKVVDLSEKIKLTTYSDQEQTNNRNQIKQNGVSHNYHYSPCNKMPRLKKMVYKSKDMKDSFSYKNKYELMKHLSNNLKTTKIQISSITSDNINFIENIKNNTHDKFYNDICVETNKICEHESLYYVKNDSDDLIESFFIKNEVVIIVRQKTVHFYEHSTGFKFFRSPKFWQHKGSLSRYMNAPEKRLSQLTNQIMYSDKVTAYVELLVRERKMSPSHDCPVCEISAIVYKNRSSKDNPDRSILHLDYAQCSMENLCFTVLPSDRAVVVGFMDTRLDDPLFILKKYLMPKHRSNNNDIIALPSVHFKCTNLQAVNEDIILGYNSENVVFWHHGYETILQIVSLSSIPKLFSNDNLAYLFEENSKTQCVWARIDTSASKGPSMHVLIFHSVSNIFVLMTASNHNWSNFKIMHIYQLHEPMGSLQSVSIGGYRLVAAFSDGGISYEFPYDIEEENFHGMSKVLNVCTYKPSTVHPNGEMVIYFKNNTAVPISIDQL